MIIGSLKLYFYQKSWAVVLSFYSKAPGRNLGLQKGDTIKGVVKSTQWPLSKISFPGLPMRSGSKLDSIDIVVLEEGPNRVDKIERQNADTYL